MSDVAADRSAGPVVARADFQYRWRVYVFFLLMFGYGLWSLRDGFFAWPAVNQRNQEMEARGQTPPTMSHNEASILINQALGVLLPAISLPLFLWLMYRSRGAYRLADGSLQVPGSPPVPLDRVRALDKSRWDRKGIAVVEYDGPDGSPARITLRDMVYERRATDEIVARIEAHLKGNEPAPAPATPS